MGGGQLYAVKTRDVSYCTPCQSGVEWRAPKGNDNSENNAEVREELHKRAMLEKKEQNAGCSVT